MGDYFQQRLLSLLPATYLQDDDGDLRTLVAILSPTLDDLKDLIDDLPRIVQVDRCEVRYLSLLASLVGISIEPGQAPERLRRRIREAVEIYRRKGTRPAIVRDLRALGWKGEFVESFPGLMRLGVHSTLNASRLAGRIHNDGTAQVRCDNFLDLTRVRSVLEFHQPAGTLFFLFGKISVPQEDDLSELHWERMAVTMRVVSGFFEDYFVLNHCRLNGRARLTLSGLRSFLRSAINPSYHSHAFTLNGSYLNRYGRLTSAT